MAREKHFLAMRSDGLGERLKAIVNAYALSELFDRDVRICWQGRSVSANKFHAISPAEEVFDIQLAQMIEASEIDEADYDVLRGNETPQDLIQRFDAATNGLVVNQGDLRGIFRACGLEDEHQITKLYDRAFRSIPFSSTVSNAIRMGYEIVVDKSDVAVHLRAGDIIYGNFRYSGRFTNKVISFPVAKKILADLIGLGKSPILFGQCERTCGILARRFCVRQAKDLLGSNNLSAVEAAIAEMVMMSRCSQIYAGASGFSDLAARIGGVNTLDARKYIAGIDITDNAMRDDDLIDRRSQVPNLQRAVAFWDSFCRARDRLSIGDKLALLDGAMLNDPENSFYAIVKVSLCLESGLVSSAEQTLEGHIGVDETALDRSVLYRVISDKSSQPYISVIRAHNDGRYPYLSFLLAFADVVDGQIESALFRLGNCVSLRRCDDLRMLAERERT